MRFGHLLDHGADVNTDHDSPLLWAVAIEHTELVSLLIKRGANASSLDGCAMRIAVKNGNVDIAKLLLDAQGKTRNQT